jgi:phospholipid-translocating ATPase
VHRAFLHNFGRNLGWWANVVVALAAVVVLELVVGATRRVYWPRDQDLMQRIERDRAVMSVLREHSAESGESNGPASGEGANHDGETAGGDAAVLEGKEKGKGKSKGSRGGVEAQAGYDPEDAASLTSDASSGLQGFTWDPQPQQRQQQQQQRQQQGLRRPRTSYDGYVPPPFTPPAEEREHHFEAWRSKRAVEWENERSKDGGSGRTATSRWLGQPAEVVETPIELQTPPRRRTGGP